MIGVLVAAIECWVSVIALIAQRLRASLSIAALTFGLLFAYKIVYRR